MCEMQRYVKEHQERKHLAVPWLLLQHGRMRCKRVSKSLYSIHALNNNCRSLEVDQASHLSTVGARPKFNENDGGLHNK